MVIAKWIPFGAQQSSATVDTKPAPLPVISSADAKKFGFENFGNTCYANSVLQALYFCAPFRELLLQSSDPYLPHAPSPPSVPPVPAPHQPRSKLQRKGSTAGVTAETSLANGSQQSFYPPVPSSPPTLFSALRSLFLYISKHPEDKGVVPPRAFIDKLKEVNELFRSTMHQDAHEFLNYLLNKIVEEIEEKPLRQPGTPLGDDSLTAATSTTSGSSPTLVHRLFEGVLTSETRCLTCETVSSRDESFLDLSIDIEQNSSVTACLRQFSASEMLCQKNKFFCDSCCDLQEAEKRMKIKKLPNILALHLKRFKYQDDVQKYIKLAYRVAFPSQLRLFNTVDDTDDADRLYELFAIVVHIGNGPHHGHYISLIKALGSWLIFDDDVVDSIKETDIPRYFGDSNAGSAYVLYYQAVDIDLVELGLRPAPPDALEQSQAQAIEPHSSPPQHSPALSPGLVEETDSSEIIDPPLTVTPSQTFLPILEKSPRKTNITLPLKMNISHSEEPPSTSATTGTSTISGLFSSLRRGPSAKARTAGPSWLEGRKSYSELSPRTAPVPPLPPLDDQAKMILPSPSSEKPRKEPDEKASTWFKRKNHKTRLETGSEHSPIVPSQADEDGAAQSPATSSSAWYWTAADSRKHSSEEQSRRPSEPYLSDHKATSSFTSSPRQAGTGFLDRNQDRPNGYDSPVDSGSSSIASTSNTHPYKHVDFPKFSASSTQVHMLPPGAQPPVSVLHKRSLSQLGQKRKSQTTPAPSQIPARPVSASDGPRGRRPSQPVPPVPSLPPSTPKSPFFPVSNGKATERREPQFDSVKGKGKDEAPEQHHDAFHYTPGQGFGTFGIANSSTSTMSRAGSNLKRVSRKLSVTSPILGFGRKDKEKQKERDSDKDKGTFPPQSAFPYSGMMAPRI